HLKEIPLTRNGKIDKRALLAEKIEPVEARESYVEPRDEVEEMVAGIWAEVLDAERVGVHDNFFDLGGHSLLATQVLSRLRESLGTDIPLRLLFETPTVAGIASAISSRKGAS